MTKYDITLKSILRSEPTQFLRLLGVEGEYSEVSPHFPDTRERRVDFVMCVKAHRKRPYLVHVELQAAPDKNIATRMLNYRTDIRTWQEVPENGKFRGLNILQVMVYLGRLAWKPKTEIREENLNFRYRFVDLKRIDPGPLLESDNIGDVVLAVLCRDGRRSDVIRRVVERIAAAPESERPNAVTKLSVLSDLRGIGPRVQSELEKMGIPVNLEESTLLRGAFDRVRNEARAETSIDDIIEVLQARFPGELPADLKDRLANLDQDDLKAVLRQSAIASSVEEALAERTLERKS